MGKPSPFRKAAPPPTPQPPPPPTTTPSSQPSPPPPTFAQTHQPLTRPLTHTTPPRVPPPSYQTPDWEGHKYLSHLGRDREADKVWFPPEVDKTIRRQHQFAYGESSAGGSGRSSDDTMTDVDLGKGGIRMPDMEMVKEGGLRGGGSEGNAKRGRFAHSKAGAAWARITTTYLAQVERFFPQSKSHYFSGRIRIRRKVLLWTLGIFTILALLTFSLGLGLGIKHWHRASADLALAYPWRGSAWVGDLTYYSPSVGVGACGELSADTDLVVALPHALFDTLMINRNPNDNPACGARLAINGVGGAVNETGAVPSTGGKTVVVRVVDRCPGCVGHALDLSPRAFAEVVGSDWETRGRVTGIWRWLDTEGMGGPGAVD